MTERIPGAPHRSGSTHARSGLAFGVALVVATGSMAAGAIANPTHGWIQPDSAALGVAAAMAGPTVTDSTGDGPLAAVYGPSASWFPDPTPTTISGGDPPPVASDGAATYPAPRLTYHGSRKRPVVALTFDDGWSTENGRLILAILEHQNVKATFFVNGVWLAKDPPLWRAIANAGHVVANHTWRHTRATEMTESELIADLRHTARAWKAITGRTLARLFRPPYGTRTAATDVAAAKAGYPDVIVWDTPANDTFGYSDWRVYRYATAGRAGSIVLMHMGPDVTPRILARVIASYRRRGFGFVTVPQLLPARPKPPAPPPSEPVPEPPVARLPEILLLGPS